MRKWVAKPKSGITKASVSPTIADLNWAAGFLEGEGTFIRAKSSIRGCEMICAPQKDAESLLRLQRFFGGNISSRPTAYDYRMHVWQVYGARARGIMMTLFSLMGSARQNQIRTSLIGG